MGKQLKYLKSVTEKPVCAPWASDDGNPPELMSAGCSSPFVCRVLQSSVIYLLSVYCSDFYRGSRGQQTKWVANRRKCSEVSVWIPLPTGSQKPVFRNTATRQRFHNKASIIAHLFEVWEMREKTGSPGKSRCSFINRDEHKSSFHYGEQLRATNALKDTRRE